MLRTPPDVLITTPESLYLLLTSRAREMLTGVEAVIVDEVHAVAATKRGAHLALSLERLADLCERDPQRVALSATQRPLEEIARFVGGDRDMRIVDAGMRKELDLRVEMPVEAERGRAGGLCAGRQRRRLALPLARALPRAARAGARASLDDRVREQPAHGRATGPAAQRAERTGRPRPPRLALARGAHRGRGGAQGRTLPCIVATSSLELGIDMGAVDLVVQVSSPGRWQAGCSASAAPATRWAHPRGRIYRASAGSSWRPRPSPAACSRARSSTRACRAFRSTSSASRSSQSVGRGTADRRAARARPARLPLSRADARAARERARPARRTLPLRRRRAAPAHRVGAHHGSAARPRGAQRIAIANAGTIPDRGLYGVFLVDGGGRVGESTRRWCTRPAKARSSCSAPPPGASSRSRATACSSRPPPASPPRCRSGRASRRAARSSWDVPSAACSASSPRSTTRAP